MRIAILSAALSLAACGQDGPQRGKLTDEEAIAAVEAAQNRLAPLVAIDPQPLTSDDTARIEPGPRCSFRPGITAAGAPIVISGPSLAWLKLDGELLKLASDPGGPELPQGTWEHYVGKTVTMRIEWPGGTGSTIGGDGQAWPVTLVLRDATDRIAYRATGILSCAS